MRQVWRYALFGLGVIGVIWGIVMLFSQVWQAVVAFVVALACFVATRLVAREEVPQGGAVAKVGVGGVGVSVHEPRLPDGAGVAQDQDPADSISQGDAVTEIAAESAVEDPLNQIATNGVGETHAASDSEEKPPLGEGAPSLEDPDTEQW